MLADCPDPSEVTDFHFLQLRTLRITKNKSVPVYSRNLLAGASKYGLLFVGVAEGFNVIKLETVLTLDEDKENRSIIENYSYDFVPSGTPDLLSVNANQTTLAVCVKCATNVINLYNLSSYHGSGNIWQPFSTNTLSAEVQDLVWNPAIENLYTVCLSDSSLQIHEVSGMTVKVIATHQGANVVAVCWSPKGKQLVAGKSDGSFTQYKPNLAEVKTIPPPPLEESLVSVASICWIANTLFAVVYVIGDTPNLFIVSTSKDSAHMYTNFYDVCLGNNSAPHQRYLLHLESSWGILLCSSLDSIEIAVLGDMPNWVQWDLKEDGKALLPGKDGATHAVGMTVMYSAQRQLVINESESYPPMPILFLLTDNGLLVSFHMINSNPSAASLVSAPLPLENSAGGDIPVTEASLLLLQQVPSTSNQPFMPSTSFKGHQVSGEQASVQKNRELGNNSVIQNFARIESSAKPSVSPSKESSVVNGDAKKSESILYSQVQHGPTNNHVGLNPLLSLEEIQNEVQSSAQNSYMTAIISEIQSFVKELQDLKQLQSSTPAIDCEEDMVKLKMFAINLHNFQKDILETMQSISSDIYTLKNVLLESFVMVEEAYSREKRRNDHSYVTLLKERALDPITAKRMKKMTQHYQYLCTQMREVSDRLDQDWIHLCSDKGRRSLNNMCISSTEAIYKTIVNNQKIIHNLRKKVDILMKKSEERRLFNTTKSASWSRYHKRLVQEDLSKLADEFLQVKIAHPEECEPTETTKKLSLESQNVLKAFLKQSNVVTVRPTSVYYPSHSRLLSNAVPSDDFSISDHDHKKDVTDKQISSPAIEKEVPEAVTFSCDVQTPSIAPKLTFSYERTPNLSAHIPPVYEAITPPDIVNVTVPAHKNLGGNNVSESSTNSEKHSEQVYHQPLFKTRSSVESSAESCTDQETSSNIISNINSKVENPPNVGGKPLAFTQTSPESVPSVSTSLFFPKTLSFASSPQKTAEIATPNPLTVVGNKAVASPAATNVQFPSSSGSEIKDIQSVVSINSSATSSNKISSLLEIKNTTESSQFSQLQTSFAQSSNMNIPITSSTGYSIPDAKAAQLPSPSLFIQPENKTLFVMSSDKKPDSSSEKSNVGFFFQKLSDNDNQTNDAAVTTKGVSESPPSVAANEIADLSLTPNKTEYVISKLSQSSQIKGVEKSITVHSTSTLPSQTPTALNQKSESSETAGNQPVITNKFVNSIISNISDTKQIDPLPDPPTFEPSVASTTTGAPVSETVQNSIILPVISADMSKSSPVVCTVSGISQSDLSVLKSSTPHIPVLPSVTATTTAGATTFGQSATVTTAIGSGTVSNTTVSSTESSSSVPTFAAKTAPMIGPSGQEMPSFFGAAKVFTQTSVTQPSVFGQTASNPTFSSTSGGFFSQVPSFGPTAATSTTSSSDFNNQTSTFSFGKPAFGQTSGSFGLAKSFFGQNPTPFTQAGSSSSFSFGQNSNNVFGQGSFFSGLGGKPSEENASKNVFGLSNNTKLNSDTTNLFKNSSVTSFGSVNSGPFSSTGSFSSGGGSVAQAGFGAFQQNASPQPGSFGSAPSFGGAPSFGSPPAFGSSPGFGSGNALSSSVFAQQQVTSNFSNFANASSPTFGSLASQSPGFGNSSPVSGFGSQGTAFGSSPVFGGSSFVGQSSSFGSPGSPPGNSSAFTQWRN